MPMTIIIFTMSPYYLHATCFLYSSNLKLKWVCLKYFTTRKAVRTIIPCFFIFFCWVKKKSCTIINLARMFGKECSIAPLIRPLTMRPNSTKLKKMLHLDTSVPEFPIFTNILFLPWNIAFYLYPSFKTYILRPWVYKSVGGNIHKWADLNIVYFNTPLFIYVPPHKHIYSPTYPQVIKKNYVLLQSISTLTELELCMWLRV